MASPLNPRQFGTFAVNPSLETRITATIGGGYNNPIVKGLGRSSIPFTRPLDSDDIRATQRSNKVTNN